jgi:hypothetical protein
MMTSTLEPALPVAVIGAGRVGLAAAVHLAERGRPFLVVEAGSRAGASVTAWGQVRLFSPWRYNIDAAARRLLQHTGWTAPDPDELPRGADLVADYLAPLAAHPLIAPQVRYRSRVVAVSRVGLDRVRTAGREQAPFVLRLADGSQLLAAAVIDASGTWATPNPLGGNGLPAAGGGSSGQSRSIACSRCRWWPGARASTFTRAAALRRTQASGAVGTPSTTTAKVPMTVIATAVRGRPSTRITPPADRRCRCAVRAAAAAGPGRWR